MELSHLTSEKYRKRLSDDPRTVGVLALGSIEQHGPHLPLATDYLGAEYIAREACSRVGHSLLLPPLPYGVSEGHAAWPGTMSLSPATFQTMLIELTESLVRHGLMRFLWLNHHGGNVPSLLAVRQELGFRHRHVQIAIPDPHPAVQMRRYSTLDIHAGKAETDFMLSLYPDLVDMESARALPSTTLPDGLHGFLGNPADPVSRCLLDAILPFRTENISECGVVSTLAPGTASGGSGEFIERWTQHIVEILNRWH